jgi:hypothetical protein
MQDEHTNRRKLRINKNLSYFLSGEEIKALPVPDVKEHIEVQPDSINVDIVVNKSDASEFSKT